jgi:hypothetical protein
MTLDAPDTPWEAIARRDFVGWRGLPDDVTIADVDTHFPRVTRATGQGFLGTDQVPERFSVHRAEGYPLDLLAWHDQSDRLVLVEAELPDLATLPTLLLADLGEPAATADHRWDVLDVAGGVHVHPERGITLFVGPEGQIVRLLLYVPTDLATYVSRRHRSPTTTELP